MFRITNIPFTISKLCHTEQLPKLRCHYSGRHVALSNCSQITTNFTVNECDAYKPPCFSNLTSNFFVFNVQCRTIRTSRKMLAGHSQWQNRQAGRLEQSNQMARSKNMFRRRCENIMKATGVTDPKSSSQLMAAMDQAKSSGIAKGVIETILKAAANNLVTGNDMVMEAVGPSRLVLLVEYVILHETRSKLTIRQTLKNHGFAFTDKQEVFKSFIKKSYVNAAPKEGEEEIDLDTYVEVAIEAGAEDVKLQTLDDGAQILKFECGGEDVSSITAILEQKGVNIIDDTFEYLPLMKVDISESDKKVLDKLADNLAKLEPVKNVFINADYNFGLSN